jgi:hypothetical protein
MNNAGADVRTYQQREILELAAMNRGLFERWVAADLIFPTHGGGGEGPGVHRQFSFWDVVQIAVLCRLHAAGVVTLDGLRAARVGLVLLDTAAELHIGLLDERGARLQIRDALRGRDPQTGRLRIVGGELDEEARRWKSFKARPNKAIATAMLVLQNSVIAPPTFIDAFEQLEALTIRTTAEHSVWLMVSMADLVADLEAKTGDRLV